MASLLPDKVTPIANYIKQCQMYEDNSLRVLAVPNNIKHYQLAEDLVFMNSSNS